MIGNCVFQSLKAMFAGLGFESESPVVLLLRTALFGFLLIFSRDICNIGLSIGKTVMLMLGIPNNVTITTPDESVFDSIDASWLLVIIIGFILGFQLIKLFFEIAERYVVVAVLTLLCPVGLAMGGSKSTKDICTGFIRTYASMIVMMVMNVLFLKLILSALSTMPSGATVLPWCLLVVGIARTARKADNLISKIGLNPAITGDPLGHGRGSMMAVMAARTIIRSVSKSGKAKSDKAKTGSKTGVGSSKAHSNTRNMSGGTNVGGSNVHNGESITNHSEHTSSLSAANSSANSHNTQNAQSSQSNRFGAPSSTSSAKSASSSRFGSVNHNSASNIGTMTSGNMHFSGSGSTRVNTNRFGAQTNGMPGKASVSKSGTAHPAAAGGGKTSISEKIPAGGKTTAKSPAQGAAKAEKKSTDKSIGKTSPKAVRFGASPEQAKTTPSGGLRQNANPFKGSGTHQPSGQMRTNIPTPIHSASQSRIESGSQQSVNETPASSEFSEKDGEKDV